jgi:hypothetical protein
VVDDKGNDFFAPADSSVPLPLGVRPA